MDNLNGNNVGSVKPDVQNVDINDFLCTMDGRIKRMEEQINRFTQVIPDVLGKMTKEISVIKCDIELLAKHQGPLMNSHEVQQAQTESENFDDLEIMPKLTTTEEVAEFENKLQNNEYKQRITRYYKKKWFGWR